MLLGTMALYFYKKEGHVMKSNLMPVIKAILQDEEFLRGGIFQKEDYYKKKYNLTREQISNIQTCLWYALNITDECYNERVSNMVK